MNFDRILSLLRNPAGFTADELRTARLIAADIIESIPKQVATMERVALDDGDVLVVHIPEHLSEDRLKTIKKHIEMIPPFIGHEVVIMGGGMRMTVLSPPAKATAPPPPFTLPPWLPICPCAVEDGCQSFGVGSGYQCRDAWVRQQRDAAL